jgi:hypothetical protein
LKSTNGHSFAAHAGQLNRTEDIIHSGHTGPARFEIDTSVPRRTWSGETFINVNTGLHARPRGGSHISNTAASKGSRRKPARAHHHLGGSRQGIDIIGRITVQHGQSTAGNSCTGATKSCVGRDGERANFNQNRYRCTWWWNRSTRTLREPFRGTT